MGLKILTWFLSKLIDIVDRVSPRERLETTIDVDTPCTDPTMSSFHLPSVDSCGIYLFDTSYLYKFTFHEYALSKFCSNRRDMQHKINLCVKNKKLTQSLTQFSFTHQLDS